MQCNKCQAEVLPDAQFCHQCGNPLHGPTGTVTSSEETVRDRFAATVAEKQAAPGASPDDDEPEQTLWEGTYSKLAMVGSWALAVVLTIGLVIVAIVAGFSGTGWLIAIAALVVVWIALVLLLFYRQYSVHYTLTDQRFVHERGILWRETDRIEAIDIDDVAYSQGPVERMFGVGTVSIHSSDKSHPQLDLPGIEKVREVAASIDEVRRQERRKRGLYVESV